MNGNEIRRLAHATNAHRPDWLVSSLTTFISRTMSSWTYRDASVALAFIATDPKPDGTPASDTPKRVLENGPWRQAAAIGGSSSMRAHPPRKDEVCTKHPAYDATNCGGCRADALAATYDDEPTTGRDTTEGTRLRAEIQARRERRAGERENT